jgi:ABC-type dipeptide/oligopeptide/nickel transport system ATPase component
MITDPPRILASFPFQLSGGQLQRVLIALAFALGPRLIIADEPTTALDMSAQGAVLDLLVSRARKHGTGVLLISHNLPLVRRYADRVAVMRQGAIVESGTAAEVLAAPRHTYTRALIAALPANTLPRAPLPVPHA